MTAAPRCPRDHVKWGRNVEMDLILVPPGGWSCSGILLDGSDCGYEIGVVRAAPVDEAAGLRDLVAEILGKLEHSRVYGGRAWIADLPQWRKRARLEPS